jgi:probable F420-dependent oxidoreductase
MRVGYALPQVGAAAGPEAVSAVAKEAEAMGFDDLWVLDRLLVPTAPEVPYPVGDGTIPPQYQTALDPMATLNFVAGQTSRIRLGTSIINVPWYNPVLLARQFTSLDVLSGGRAIVGLGIGWSTEEYRAAGVPWEERGKRANESLEAMTAIWTSDPVEYTGSSFAIAKSTIGPKPVQKPHPPIYMAAYVPPALRRIAKYADGWFPVGIPIAALPEMFGGLKDMTKAEGRDPDALDLVVRANVEVSETPISGERQEFTGTLEQIAEDVAATKRIDADAFVIDMQFSPDVTTTADYIRRMKDFWELTQNA